MLSTLHTKEHKLRSDERVDPVLHRTGETANGQAVNPCVMLAQLHFLFDLLCVVPGNVSFCDESR